MRFDSSFIWGAATAAYQIEGAAHEDGRGESIWDRFCRVPGKVANGDTGDTACDHYHRYAEDIALLKELGVDAYRFSIAWPRIIPDGYGAPNQSGLDFYRRLAEELLEAGIRPFATLFHWDLPQSLEDLGGWTSRETAYRYADYVAVTVDELSDLIKDWMTLNEPYASSIQGYYDGSFAPGRNEKPETVAQVIHNLLLAHGLGVDAVKSNCSPGSEVGIVINAFVSLPVSDKPEDIAAAQRQCRMENGWWFDPMYKGTYPDGTWMNIDGARPVIHPGDMEIISRKTDFVGLNVYTANFVADDPSSPTGTKQIVPVDCEVTDMAWPVVPEAIYEAIRWVNEEYKPEKIYVGENGAAYRDIVSSDGNVHDPQRIEYIQRYISELGRAADEECPVRGYFLWSLLDNFEWCQGYSKRFGIVYVDYENANRRIPKDSYYYYRNHILKMKQERASEMLKLAATAEPTYTGSGGQN